MNCTDLSGGWNKNMIPGRLEKLIREINGAADNREATLKALLNANKYATDVDLNKNEKGDKLVEVKGNNNVEEKDNNGKTGEYDNQER